MLISALPFHEASHDEEQRGPRRYLKENLRGQRNLLLGVDLERLGAAPASQGSVHRLLSRCGMPRHGGEAENLARRPPSGASSSRRRGLQAPPSPSLPTPFSLLPRPRGMNTNGKPVSTGKYTAPISLLWASKARAALPTNTVTRAEAPQSARAFIGRYRSGAPLAQ